MGVTHVQDIKSILDCTNLEGRRVFGERWKEIDQTLTCILWGSYHCWCFQIQWESTESLQDAETGRTLFRATMSHESFQIISRFIRFDNRDTRPAWRQKDELAAIRSVQDKWVDRLPLFFNPAPIITVDEQFMPFRGRCPFRQYISSKPSKYGIKTWTVKLLHHMRGTCKSIRESQMEEPLIIILFNLNLTSQVS